MPTPSRLRSTSLTSMVVLAVSSVLCTGGARADEPSALIESISGGSGSLRVMDYVAAGQVIDLGRSGRMVLSYLRSCRIETITGGRITVGAGASQIEGGQIQATEAPCQASRLELAQGKQEAAGAVYRVTAFEGQDWGERTIKGSQPIFRWSTSSSGDLASIAVIDMDRNPPAIVWKGVTDGSTLTYPANAPPLDVGVPYQVQVTVPGHPQLIANFSIDPGLEGPETILGRLVPVGPSPANK